MKFFIANGDLTPLSEALIFLSALWMVFAVIGNGGGL